MESQTGSTLRVKLAQLTESNWLNILSLIDLNIFQLLTLPGWIIVLPVTQLLGSKWLIFSLGGLREKLSRFDLKSWDEF